MRRLVFGLVGVFLLLTTLSVGLSRGSAAAMNSSGGSSSNSCSNDFPAPYTGGDGVAKFFHLSDGSTVTITNSGAVIKQGRCDTPYREGWVNVSDICSINSAQDLNGRLSPGSSNPNGSGDFTGCSSSVQSSSSPQRPSSVTIINNNSQSQSQAQAQSGSQAAANVSTATTSSTSSAHAQVQAATTTQPATQAAPAAKTLPNTGPGNIVALSGATTAIGTAGHWFYNRRSRRSK